MAKQLRAGDVIPEFRFDTPYQPQQSFYQLLEGDRPVFLEIGRASCRERV